jgi:hypothetical protein
VGTVVASDSVGYTYPDIQHHIRGGGGGSGGGSNQRERFNFDLSLDDDNDSDDMSLVEVVTHTHRTGAGVGGADVGDVGDVGVALPLGSAAALWESVCNNELAETLTHSMQERALNVYEEVDGDGAAAIATTKIITSGTNDHDDNQYEEPVAGADTSTGDESIRPVRFSVPPPPITPAHAHAAGGVGGSGSTLADKILANVATASTTVSAPQWPDSPQPTTVIADGAAGAKDGTPFYGIGDGAQVQGTGRSAYIYASPVPSTTDVEYATAIGTPQNDAVYAVAASTAATPLPLYDAAGAGGGAPQQQPLYDAARGGDCTPQHQPSYDAAGAGGPIGNDLPPFHNTPYTIARSSVDVPIYDYANVPDTPPSSDAAATVDLMSTVAIQSAGGVVGDYSFRTVGAYSTADDSVVNGGKQATADDSMVNGGKQATGDVNESTYGHLYGAVDSPEPDEDNDDKTSAPPKLNSFGMPNSSMSV